MMLTFASLYSLLIIPNIRRKGKEHLRYRVLSAGYDTSSLLVTVAALEPNLHCLLRCLSMQR
jgi:hypothetical protein